MQIHHFPLVYALINVCLHKNRDSTRKLLATHSFNSIEKPNPRFNSCSPKSFRLNVLMIARPEYTNDRQAPNMTETFQFPCSPSMSELSQITSKALERETRRANDKEHTHTA